MCLFLERYAVGPDASSGRGGHRGRSPRVPKCNPAKHPQGARRIRKAAEPPTAALRLHLGEEEQGSGRSFRRMAETKFSGLCDDEVGWVGLQS